MSIFTLGSSLLGGGTRALLLLGLLVQPAEPLATRVGPLARPRYASALAVGQPRQRLVLRRRCSLGRGIVACAEAPETEEEPDADLASAWLDDNDAGVLQGSEVLELEPAVAFEHARSGAATIVDLRTAKQFARGRAPGSVNIPAGEPGPLGLLFHFRQRFEADVQSAFDPDAKLVLLCEVGVVSRVASERLQALGLSVATVRGGYESWCMEETLPVDSDGVAEPEAAGAGMFEDDGEWSAGAAPPSLEEEFEGWVAWEGEELEFEPVIHLGYPEPAAEEELDFEEDEEDEDDIESYAPAPTRVAPTARAPAPPPPPAAAPVVAPEESPELDLDELTKLLGEGQSKELPYFSSPAARRDVAVTGDVGAIPGLDAVSNLPLTGVAAYYATSATSYGGPSRAPKGIKQRRTRGGLPPAWLVDVSHIDVHTSARDGSLDALSVKELKSFLYYRDAPLSGPKKVLVDRIVEVVEREHKEEAEREQRREERGEGTGASAAAAAADAAQQRAQQPPGGGAAMYMGEGADGTQGGDDRTIDEVFAEM